MLSNGYQPLPVAGHGVKKKSGVVVACCQHVFTRGNLITVAALSIIVIILYFVGAPIVLDTSPALAGGGAIYHKPKYRSFGIIDKLMQTSQTSRGVTQPKPKPSSTTVPFTLFDFPNFRYTIQNDVCRSDDIFVVAFVHSAPKNLANRDAIRQAWGNSSVLDGRGLRLRTVFLLAAVEDPAVQRSLEEEDGRYHDIVQGTFVDAYKNLTYKHVMGLHWVSTYCNQARFVLKTDDDIFVDVYHLVDELRAKFLGSQDLVLCNQWVGMPVLRDPASKWFVAPEEHQENTFSPYCSGWGYVLTPSACRQIFKQSFTTPYFWVDDWLVSGPMVDSAMLKRTEFNSYYIFGTKELNQWLAEPGLTQSKYIIGPTWGNSQLMRKLWAKTVAYEKSRAEKKKNV